MCDENKGIKLTLHDKPSCLSCGIEWFEDVNLNFYRVTISGYIINLCDNCILELNKMITKMIMPNKKGKKK